MTSLSTSRKMYITAKAANKTNSISQQSLRKKTKRLNKQTINSTIFGAK